MLLVESRLRKTGKDVMLHVLSYCSWSWFEVSAAAGQDALGLGAGGEADEEEDDGCISTGAKRRKITGH